jgi:hypothetical protein
MRQEHDLGPHKPVSHLAERLKFAKHLTIGLICLVYILHRLKCTKNMILEPMNLF